MHILENNKNVEIIKIIPTRKAIALFPYEKLALSSTRVNASWTSRSKSSSPQLENWNLVFEFLNKLLPMSDATRYEPS